MNSESLSNLAETTPLGNRVCAKQGENEKSCIPTCLCHLSVLCYGPGSVWPGMVCAPDSTISLCLISPLTV